MSSTETAHLIDDYVRRLEQAAQRLPATERADLVAQITEHIDEARQAGGAWDEARVRTLLDRLGSPEEIVAAASSTTPAGPAAPVAPGRPSITTEIWAVVLLTAGSLLPLVGWLVGAVLLWSSDRWRTREKLLGTLVLPGGFGGALLLMGLFSTTSTCVETSYGMADGTEVVTSSTCDDRSVLVSLLPFVLIGLLIASLVVPLWLLSVARRRADRESDPLTRTAPASG